MQFLHELPGLETWWLDKIWQVGTRGNRGIDFHHLTVTLPLRRRLASFKAELCIAARVSRNVYPSPSDELNSHRVTLECSEKRCEEFAAGGTLQAHGFVVVSVFYGFGTPRVYTMVAIKSQRQAVKKGTRTLHGHMSMYLYIHSVHRFVHGVSKHG